LGAKKSAGFSSAAAASGGAPSADNWAKTSGENSADELVGSAEIGDVGAPAGDESDI
jgi:hypothetical protein